MSAYELSTAGSATSATRAPASAHLMPTRRPKRPAGRKSRITIRSEKLNSSLSDGLRNTAPSDSASDTRSPPTKAPRRLPMPPMITMLNEATDSESPVGG